MLLDLTKDEIITLQTGMGHLPDNVLAYIQVKEKLRDFLSLIKDHEALQRDKAQKMVDQKPVKEKRQYGYFGPGAIS